MKVKLKKEVYALKSEKLDTKHTRIDVINPIGKIGWYSFSDMNYWGKASNTNLLSHEPTKIMVFEE